jgi:hypothetical protein
MSSGTTGLLDPEIFSDLKNKIEEETKVRDTLTQIVQRLERAVASAQAILSRVHSTPRADCRFSSFFFSPRLSCLLLEALPLYLFYFNSRHQ